MMMEDLIRRADVVRPMLCLYRYLRKQEKDGEKAGKIIDKALNAAAAACVKEQGLPNDLIDRVVADPAFGLERADIEAVLQPEHFTGLAPAQVRHYLDEVIRPVLAANPDCVGQNAELSV